MSNSLRGLIILLVAVAAGMALWLGHARTSPAPAVPEAADTPTPAVASPVPTAGDVAHTAVARAVGPPSGLPRLVDLGAGKCIPCKAMAPILEKLAQDHKGRLEVVFLDVWQDPEAGRAYEIGMIPTQIFYDGTGRELFRHEGFLSREEILETWKRLGFSFEGGAR
jgi:thioredoxin 1